MVNLNSKSDPQNLIFVFSVFCTEHQDSWKQQKTTNQRQKQNHNSVTLNCLLFVLIAFSIAQINDIPQAHAMFLTDSTDIYWRRINSKGTASWT